MNELDIQAPEEETNFTGARDVAATASQIQHPIIVWPVPSFLNGERWYLEDAQVINAAACMRGPGSRCTTTSRAQESSVHGTTKGHNTELFLSTMNKPYDPKGLYWGLFTREGTVSVGLSVGFRDSSNKHIGNLSAKLNINNFGD